MLFNSFAFLIFFPLVTLIYFTIPPRLQNFFLLIASCVFYMLAIPKYIIILFLLIAIDYTLGIQIETAKKTGSRRILTTALLTLSLVSNLAVLFFFKYWNFFGNTVTWIGGQLGASFLHYPFLSWALPIGLSFHTFQSMSYVIEVYKGKVPAERKSSLGIFYRVGIEPSENGPSGNKKRTQDSSSGVLTLPFEFHGIVPEGSNGDEEIFGSQVMKDGRYV